MADTSTAAESRPEAAPKRVTSSVVDSHDDPLLGCLVLLTKLYHKPFSADSLRAGLPLVNNRLTPSLFQRAAQRADLSSKIVRRPLKKISALILPCVLILRNEQACVLVSLDQKKGTAVVLQPESGDGEHEVQLKDIGKEYSGYAIFVRREHKFDERTPELLRIQKKNWFWGTLASSWHIYRDVLVASLLLNIFAIANPLFVMNVYDRVVPNNAIETLWVLAIGITVVYGFDLLLRTLRGHFIEVAGKKSDIMLSSQIFEKVMGLKLSARPPSVGAFANNLREFESVRNFITSGTIATLIDLPFVVLFLLVIWFIGGPIVIVPAMAIPIIILYGVMIQGPLRGSVEATFRASAQKNATLIESLTGMETIKALGAEGPVQRKWENNVGHIANWGVKSRLISSSSVNMATFIQQMASVAVVVFGVYLISDKEMTMGALIACVILTGRAVAPMGQVANLAANFFQTVTALKSLNQIMELPVEREAGRSFVHRPSLEGDIEFHDVSFQYPGAEVASLKNVSFRLKKGEKLAIIGRIGSGKTTLEKLLLGLYEPTSGSVTLDGIDLNQIDPADLRRNIGYIPQDIMLFFGTVRENIVYHAPFADDGAVIRAAEIAGVDEFVNRHPQGFDMLVGERGERLSGGQRQSIAVARALLLDPPIMLMDEPSNSMDNSTEDNLKTKLKGVLKDKTVILITHKASLLDLVDRVMVIDTGKVIADGPKEQVLEALKQGRLRISRR